MPRMTKEEILLALDKAIETQFIWNVDFNDLKAAANNLLYQFFCKDHEYNTESRVLRAKDGDNYRARSEHYHEITYFPTDAHGLIAFGKKLAKYGPKLKPEEKPVLAQSEKFHQDHIDLAMKLVQVKPFIAKGRKPSTDPNKTPPRTLDHTGTCACCFRNVKLENGKIVRHGYQVKYGQFIGDCFGVGFKPFEVSTEGSEAWIKAMEKQKAVWVEQLPKVKAMTTITYQKDRGFRQIETVTLTKGVDTAFASRHNSMIATLERDIDFIGRDIKDWQKRVAAWKAVPLPDGNQDHLGG